MRKLLVFEGRRRLLAAITIGALFQGIPLEARQPAGALNWEVVAAIPPTTRVRLTFLNGAIAEGILVAVESEDIVLRDTRPLKGRVVVRELAEGQAFSRHSLANVEPAVTKAVQKPMPELVKMAIWMGAGIAVVITGMIIALAAADSN